MASLLTGLPTEVKIQIASFIQDPKTFIAFSLACKDTHALLSDSNTLKKIFYKESRPDLFLESLNDFWKGPSESLKKEWEVFYKFYNATQPLLIIIKDLENFQNTWLTNLQTGQKQQMSLAACNQKKEELRKLLSNYQLTQGEEMQSKLNEAWHEARLPTDFKVYSPLSNVKDAVNRLFRHLIVKFIRLVVYKERTDFDYRDGVLMHSGLHAWALTTLPEEGQRFVNSWFNQIVRDNHPNLLLTIFRQPCFQQLLQYEKYASKVRQMIGDHEEVVLTICTDSELEPIKNCLFKSNDQYITQYAIKFPSVAQYALDQLKFIQTLNASQLKEICTSHADCFKLFELPKINQNNKVYYLFVLKPEMRVTLDKLEQEFKHYQQNPEVASFLRQKGVTSFDHFLSQVTEYSTDSTVELQRFNPIMPEAIKFLDADLLEDINLRVLANLITPETFVTSTPNTEPLESRFMSLRLSP